MRNVFNCRFQSHGVTDTDSAKRWNNIHERPTLWQWKDIPFLCVVERPRKSPKATECLAFLCAVSSRYHHHTLHNSMDPPVGPVNYCSAQQSSLNNFSWVFPTSMHIFSDKYELVEMSCSSQCDNNVYLQTDAAWIKLPCPVERKIGFVHWRWFPRTVKLRLWAPINSSILSCPVVVMFFFLRANGAWTHNMWTIWRSPVSTSKSAGHGNAHVTIGYKIIWNDCKTLYIYIR